MFQVKDVVVYGNHGVCEIVDVGTLSMPMADKEKMYYTLKPLYRKESMVYASVENRKVVMRAVVSREEADALILKIPQIETVWIVNEKVRESQYKEALQTCDCEELIKIIKTLYQRKQERLESGKKVTMIDEKYFRQAEEKLYEELAYVLGMEKSKVSEYIREQLES